MSLGMEIRPPMTQLQTVVYRPMESRSLALVSLGAFVLVAILPPLLWAGTKRGEPLLYMIGKKAALLAFGLVILQVVLAGRLRLADRALGLCAIMRVHRALGVVAFILLSAHPALLLLATRGDIPWGWPVALGASALAILLFGIFAALFFRLLRIDYNRWRVIHKAMILVVILGYLHSRAIGDDLLASRGLRVWWSVLAAVSIGVFVWRHLLVRRFRRPRFRVASVAAEARETWTIKLVAEDDRPFGYRPGQFMFLTLLRYGRPSEEHAFTISSSPTQVGFITATIKECGDYTRTIGLTRAGDLARVEGPFGRFSLAFHAVDRFLFIGAGVGCTPLVSMIRYLRDTRDTRPLLFLCANRTEADILFREELEQLPSGSRVVHILSRPGAAWQGPGGYLDEARLREFAGASLVGADAFLCGPPAFMTELRASLRRLGLSRTHIHFERFAIP
jgi:predicted ferric reductase